MPARLVKGPVLSVRELHVKRGRTAVLRRFSAELAPGGIWWVTGENGAGKSTLLRAIAGRVPVRFGELRLGERRLLGSDAAYYHPGISPPPDARVSDFLALAAALGKPIGADGLLSWSPVADQTLGSLSTGQAKRLLLALLLKSDAAVLVLDEPFDHLSESGRLLLLERLCQLAMSRIVVVSTNQPIPPWEPRTRVIDIDRAATVKPL